MAKTIMIANDIYTELKAMKGEASFTELIRGLVESANEHSKGNELVKFLGVLRGDKEYPAILKEVRKEWTAWSKKYA